MASIGTDSGQGFPAMPRYDFALAREPLFFAGPASEAFALHRLKSWAGYHTDIRKALTERGITPVAAESMNEDLRKLLPAPAGTPSYRTHEWHIVENPTDARGLYAIDAPLPGTTTSQLSVSFDKVIAHSLNHIFGFSGQPGFLQTLSADNGEAKPAYYLKFPESAAAAFADIWANRFGQMPHPAEVVRKYTRYRKAWTWVEQNVPSGTDGFSWKNDFANDPDCANRTPLENLLFPLGVTGPLSAGLLPSELATVLRSGANPFQHNLETGNSVVDELMVRNDYKRLQVVIEEAARENSPIARYVTAPVKRQLAEHIEFDFPERSRGAVLEMVAKLKARESFDLQETLHSFRSNWTPGLEKRFE